MEVAVPPEAILSEEVWILASGLQAERWQVEAALGQAAMLVAAIHRQTIRLSGLGDFSRFDEIARTLRDADPSTPR